MNQYDRLIIYFDGASRSNPHGPAGCGWAMYEMDEHGEDGHRIAHGQNYLGYNVSNNQAEYEGLEAALRFMCDNDFYCNCIYIRGDLEVVIKQLEGEYKVRSNNIKGYYNAVKNLLYDVEPNTGPHWYAHIPRYENFEADSLANNAIDYQGNNSFWD